MELMIGVLTVLLLVSGKGGNNSCGGSGITQCKSPTYPPPPRFNSKKH